MRRLTALRTQVHCWRQVRDQVHTLQELAELDEAALEQEFAEDITRLEAASDELETETLFNGPYAQRDCLLSVHAGAGGTDSQDWASMLLRMYTRWAERHDYAVELLDLTPGEEAGIKSATIRVSGLHAYGRLRAEHGVHRLVRLSPFDANHRRHTSFALVEVLPVLVDDLEVEISPDDLRIDMFRSSGPGGQNVNKVNSAVRITHIPTGTVVSCQSERSQTQNREIAMQMLRSRLLEQKIRAREQQEAALKGERVSAEWGNQIRSYVLHPYTLVKDLRTGVETGNITAVLDGDLDAFIHAYLVQSAQQALAARADSQKE
jgi:peptide chain release factor 2